MIFWVYKMPEHIEKTLPNVPIASAVLGLFILSDLVLSNWSKTVEILKVDEECQRHVSCGG